MIREGLCIVCGQPLIIQRTDNIPMCAECDKRARQVATGKKKKNLMKSPHLCLSRMRYVAPEK